MRVESHTAEAGGPQSPEGSGSRTAEFPRRSRAWAGAAKSAAHTLVHGHGPGLDAGAERAGTLAGMCANLDIISGVWRKA